MPFRSVEFHHSRLQECLDLHPGHIGNEIVGPENALIAWQAIVRDFAFQAGCVEDSETGGLIGFGAGVFVSQEWAELELANPAPLLNARLIEAVSKNRSPLLTWKQIAMDNAAGTLHLVILYSNWRLGHSDPVRAAEVHMLLALNFARLYAGYRLGRLIAEAADIVDLRTYQMTPGCVPVDRYWNFFDQHPKSTINRDRALVLVTRETVMAAPATVATPLFLHGPEPYLGLGRLEQELLLAALERNHDEAIAFRLNISIAAVKRRWAKAFATAGEKGLFDLEDGSSRGKKKRDRIVDYVRLHPEELRPYLPRQAHLKHKSNIAGK